MTQRERREFLIQKLLAEREQYRGLTAPPDEEGQRRLLRSLMNVRAPSEAPDGFLPVQDAYLREETAAKGVVDIETLFPLREGVYVWRGDITRLRCDAIVNAANSGMTGCYVPCHGCIDNSTPV